MLLNTEKNVVMNTSLGAYCRTIVMVGEGVIRLKKRYKGSPMTLA